MRGKNSRKRNTDNSLKIEDLKPAPYNPRIIDEKSKQALSESLKKFGDISGIVWNRTSGHLVCGHQRLEALKKEYPELKIENNTIIADGKSFPIRIVEWDEQTEKLANIAANSQYISGTYDMAKLEDIIDELKPLNFDEIKSLRIDEFEIPVFDEEFSNIEDEKHNNKSFTLKISIPIRTWTIAQNEIKTAIEKVICDYGGEII